MFHWVGPGAMTIRPLAHLNAFSLSLRKFLDSVKVLNIHGRVSHVSDALDNQSSINGTTMTIQSGLPVGWTFVPVPSILK